jgi:hypothetical protein
MVAEQVLSGEAYEVAEGYFLFDALSDDCKQQIGYQRTPYLYLDGIFVIP